MSSVSIIAAGEFDFILFIVVALIGIGTWIKEMLVRSAKRKRASEQQGEPEVPVSTKISREIRKYLGEIPEKPKAKAAVVHFKAPPPLPERLRPDREVKPEPEKQVKKKLRVIRKKAPRRVRTPRGVLLDRAGLRQAILYREILGPPVSMRRKRPVSKLTRR